MIHATVKLHKTGNPVRPIDNWKECPVYELAKEINKILQNKLARPNTFNITNSRTLNTKACKYGCRLANTTLLI